jgi:hypothetical protein
VIPAYLRREIDLGDLLGSSLSHMHRCGEQILMRLAPHLPKWVWQSQLFLDVEITDDGLTLRETASHTNPSNTNPFVVTLPAPVKNGMAPSHLKDQLAALKQRHGADEIMLVHRLGPSDAIIAQIGISAVAAGNLPNVISWRAEELSPLPLNEMCFDYRVDNHFPSTGDIDVEIIMVPRHDIERIQRHIEGFGLTVDVIDVDGLPPRRPINLIPRGARPSRRGRWRRAAFLAASVVCGLIAITGLPYWLRESQLAKLRVEIDIASAESAPLLVERRRLQDLVVLHDIVRAEHAAAPLASELLAALADHAGPSTIFEQIGYRDGTMRLTGTTISTSALADRLGKSPFFAQASYAAPVVTESSPTAIPGMLQDGSNETQPVPRERFSLDVALENITLPVVGNSERQ